MQRREFLKRAGGLAASMAVGVSVRADRAVSLKGLSLVAIQLAGGNDGLNTVVPYRNDGYYRLRPQLALPRRLLLPLDGDFGLHPVLTATYELYQEGRLAVIQGVGSKTPPRSHFSAQRRWRSRLPAPMTDFSTIEFEAALDRIIKEPCPAACLRLSGFDTHVQQALPDDPARGRHADLLRRLDRAIGLLFESFERDRLLLLISSEFGRSPAENRSLGTDHGTIQPVLVAGERVKGGVFGTLPSLEPDEGDEQKLPLATTEFGKVWALCLPLSQRFSPVHGSALRSGGTLLKGRGAAAQLPSA